MQLILRPAGERAFKRVEECGKFPAAGGSLIEVAHTLYKKFTIPVPFVTVGFKHLEFLIVRIAGKNALFFDCFHD